MVEQAWENNHLIHLEETSTLDHDRGQELQVKEALHIQTTLVEEHFKEDGRLEVPGCWTTVMRSNPYRPLTSSDMYLKYLKALIKAPF